MRKAKQEKGVNSRCLANESCMEVRNYISPRDVAHLSGDLRLKVDTAILCARLQSTRRTSNIEERRVLEKLRSLLLDAAKDWPGSVSKTEPIFQIEMRVSEIKSLFSAVSQLPPFSFIEIE